VSEAFWSVLLAYNYVVIAYFALLHTVYLGTSFFAFGALRRYALRLKSIDLTDLITSAWAPPITLIAPAYNEEATCVESVRSLLTLEYPEFEILVVNDGSSDRTLERLIEAFHLTEGPRVPTADLEGEEVRTVLRSRRHPNLWVIDKKNGGKADALNVGLNFCQTPLFCAMDADSLIEPQALIRIVRPFLEDATTVAAGGVLRIANGCRVSEGRVVDVRLPRSLLARLQVLEYLRAFLVARMGWDALNATLVISGAFGIFRRDTVTDAGGYRTDTVGEDMELVVRLHRHCREKGIPYRIYFVPDPVAWTECPESLATLSRQRDRWQRGLAYPPSDHAPESQIRSRGPARLSVLLLPGDDGSGGRAARLSVVHDHHSGWPRELAHRDRLSRGRDRAGRSAVTRRGGARGAVVSALSTHHRPPAPLRARVGRELRLSTAQRLVAPEGNGLRDARGPIVGKHDPNGVRRRG
jgi:cellulose synthase/poly-beta-1,6-N-acetylglucosamine synthase-like glycosyltransferase